MEEQKPVQVEMKQSKEQDLSPEQLAVKRMHERDVKIKQSEAHIEALKKEIVELSEKVKTFSSDKATAPLTIGSKMYLDKLHAIFQSDFEKNFSEYSREVYLNNMGYRKENTDTVMKFLEKYETHFNERLTKTDKFYKELYGTLVRKFLIIQERKVQLCELSVQAILEASAKRMFDLQEMISKKADPILLDGAIPDAGVLAISPEEQVVIDKVKAAQFETYRKSFQDECESLVKSIDESIKAEAEAKLKAQTENEIKNAEQVESNVAPVDNAEATPVANSN